MSDERSQTERVEDDLTGSDYDRAVLDEPSTSNPGNGDPDPELTSTLPAGTNVDHLRDGGPPPAGGGIMTTTGGTAGPNSFRTPPRSGPGVANTTTGDATTGAMDTATDGSTSDASN